MPGRFRGDGYLAMKPGTLLAPAGALTLICCRTLTVGLIAGNAPVVDACVAQQVRGGLFSRLTVKDRGAVKTR
jgi:hypothetical protein